MRTGFAALTVAYVLSQFYRAFLAVLAPVLDADIGASAEDLAFASGIWLAAFAGLQLPIGYALDHLGPRRTAGGLVLAAVGAAIFALAQGPVAVTVAMAVSPSRPAVQHPAVTGELVATPRPMVATRPEATAVNPVRSTPARSAGTAEPRSPSAAMRPAATVAASPTAVVPSRSVATRPAVPAEPAATTAVASP